jgi:hypothetical protein
MLPQYWHLIFSDASSRNSSTFSEYRLRMTNLAISIKAPATITATQTRKKAIDWMKKAGMRRKNPKNQAMMASISRIVDFVSVLDPLGGSIGSSPSSLIGLPHDKQKTELSGISDLHPGHFNGSAVRIGALGFKTLFEFLSGVITESP